MPGSIERRWRALGVLTKDGAPNAAMRNWAKCLLAGKETEEVLGGVVFTLSCVYEGESVSAIGIGGDFKITV